MEILLADDSKIIRQRIKKALYEKAGIDRIHEACTIADTMQSLASISPEVLILDIRMPDGSGMDVLKTVKTYAEPPVVIMFTNYPYPQYRKKCMEMGADYFFDKSEDFENLIAYFAERRQQSSGSTYKTGLMDPNGG